MNKTISVERLYSLGDYQNIKFKSEISNIGEEVLQDPIKVSALELLIIIDMEKNYRTYIDIVSKTPPVMDNDLAMRELENMRLDVYKLLENTQNDPTN